MSKTEMSELSKMSEIIPSVGKSEPLVPIMSETSKMVASAVPENVARMTPLLADLLVEGLGAASELESQQSIAATTSYYKRRTGMLPVSELPTGIRTLEPIMSEMSKMSCNKEGKKIRYNTCN